VKESRVSQDRAVTIREEHEEFGSHNFACDDISNSRGGNFVSHFETL